MMRHTCTGLIGLASLAWAASTLPIFYSSAPFERLAQTVIAGDSFKDDVLSRAVGAFDTLGPTAIIYSSRMRAGAILRLRLVESEFERGTSIMLDERVSALADALRLAVAANPADPFLWLGSYWLRNTQGGFAPSNIASLSTSYALGPREGWIALRRNRLGLVIFPQLDAPTQDLVVSEFAGMVDSRYINDATLNLAGPGWTIRDRLVDALADIDPATKLALARSLYSRGVNLTIPGVDGIGERPWR